jgi:lipopolysaccharide cholinephosphotransferase
MATYEIRPLQLKILEILDAVDKACRENNLRYYLTAGTMLGAVRHKGFIPWDDDADIAMPRPDYEKLIANATQWLPKRYEVICAENDDNYPLPFAKIQDAETTIIERHHLKYIGGAYIDVFPLDGVPDGKIAQWWHFFRYQYYKKVNYFVYRDPYKHGHGPACWLPLMFQKLYSKQWVKQKLRKMMTAYDYDKSRLIVDHDDGWRGVMQKEILGEPTPVIFEGKEFLGVENFDKYLSQKYGDYMTIPPHNDQHQHNFYYLNLEKPYREFDESDVDHSI